MKALIYAWLIARLMILTVLVFTSRDALATDLESRYEQFYSSQRAISAKDISSKRKAELIADAYRLMKDGSNYGKDLSTSSDSDLLLLFRAADEAGFYTSSVEHAQDMQSIYLELDKRKRSSAKQVEQTYFSLIAAREYNLVRQWRDRFDLVGINPTDYEISPGKKHLSAPSELILEKTGIKRRIFSFPKGPFVLVIAHPQCHFSRYAVEMLTTDPEISKVLDAHIKWLAPQQREKNMRLFEQWNLLHPSAPISQAYKISEFPLVDIWETPTFYFFDNGALKARIIGWPKLGRMEELNEALKSVGLR